MCRDFGVGRGGGVGNLFTAVHTSGSKDSLNGGTFVAESHVEGSGD